MVLRSDKRDTRGVRPDAVIGGTWYLLKKVSHIRLTGQIRLLTAMAHDVGATVEVRVPKGCTSSGPLVKFVTAHARNIRIEYV